MLAVAVGLAALIETSAHVYTAVKLLGAGYLVFLGLKAIRHRHVAAGAAAEPPVIARRKVLREGFVVGMTNPKMIVFFAAALPQFVDRGAGHVSLQMVAIGLIVPVIALACDSVWALAAGTARGWFAGSPRRVERMSDGRRGGDGRCRHGAGAVRRPRRVDRARIDRRARIAGLCLDGAMTFSALHHLECPRCGAEYDAFVLQGVCPQDGSPLLARYDLQRVGATSCRRRRTRARTSGATTSCCPSRIPTTSSPSAKA